MSVAASGSAQCTLRRTSVGSVPHHIDIAINPLAGFMVPVPTPPAALPLANLQMNMSWYTLQLLSSRSCGVVPCVDGNVFPFWQWVFV